ncbi:MAG: TonB-dependent receptor [Bacteroidetes bacterium]|nr:TonB-dependent receptor [Bacteroidota bacterium]
MQLTAKILLCMRITAILLLAFMTHVSATGVAQTVTLSGKNIPLEKVFREIHGQTGFNFFYRSEWLSQNDKVSLYVTNAPLQDVLDVCFKGKSLSFTIIDKSIVVKKAEETAAPPIPFETITGRIIDETGQPVSKATITIQGKSGGAQTDADGRFTINASPGDILLVSYVGYNTAKITVLKNKTDYSLSLTLANRVLGDVEVIAVGYGTTRRKDITGAVSVVNVEDMNKQPTNQITSQLQGQAPGVTIIGSGQPGDPPQVRIRGINTFGDNTPLFVVDGVPTLNIADLNPNDISSVQILKDAGAASIYGSRAANGVIILTTKKGKNGKPVIAYDSYTGFQTVSRGNVWNALSPIDMAKLKFQALANSGTPVTPSAADILYGAGPDPSLPDYINPAGAHEGDPSVNPSLYFVNPNYTNASDPNGFYQITKANKAGTNWFKEITRTAPMTNQNISVSGATDNARYLFSLNYFNQQGAIINTYLKKYVIRSNTSYNITKDIRIGENISYSITDNPKLKPLQGGSAIAYSFRDQTIIPVYDILGNYGGTNSDASLGDSPNPVATQKRTANNHGLDRRLFGNVYADIDVLKHFTIHTSFGGEDYSGYAHSFQYPTYENKENTLTNSYSESSYSGYNWTWTNTLAYHQTFATDHDLKILGGVESYDEESQKLGATGYGYFSFDPNFTTLSSASGAITASSSRTGYGLWSQFGRVDYSYKEKYIVSATIRRDGSSKFKTHRYGVFPAFSAAWRLSQEKFMENVSWISDLKIRGGWGIMGNQINLGADNAYYTFTGNKNNSYYDLTGTNNSVIQGFSVGQIGNPDAKWESDVNTNIGFDASLFKGAIDITADYYIKDIKDLLYNPTLPGTYGTATVPYQNVAAMRNHGIDFSITGRKNLSRDFRLSTTLTFTSFNNKVTKVTQSTNYFLSGDVRNFGAQFIRNQVGHPVGSFYGYKIIGFWNKADEITQADAAAQHSTGDPAAAYQTDEGVGRFRYADINGDGQVTDADRTFLGNPNPNFNYGINLGAAYKSFDFSIFFYGVSGNQIWNQVRWWTDFYPSFAGAKSHTALYDSWTPTHMNAKAPIQENVGYASTNALPNSYYVESGSYFRAKNAMLGYTLPRELVQKAHVQSLRFYLQVTNLFTVTRYSGLDPEINGNGVTEFGIDEGPYPNSRQYLVGVSLKF